MSHEPLALDIIGEPFLQPWPCPCERFVRQLHRLLIGREQACINQPIDDPGVGVVNRDTGALEPTGDHRAVRGCFDEAEDDVAQ